MLSRYFKFSILILTFLVATMVTALGFEVEGLLVWEVKDQQTKLILPKIKGFSADEIAQKYLAHLNDSEEYRYLVDTYTDKKEGKFSPETVSLKDFKKIDVDDEAVPMAIISNRIGHMDQRDPFFSNVYHNLSKRGADLFIIPIGMEAFLTKEEIDSFHSIIAKEFPAIISLGGGDVHPSLYNAPLSASSGYLNKSRDTTEINLIRASKRSHGAYFGFCRGHQIFCVSEGACLEQLRDDQDEDVRSRAPKHAMPNGGTDACSLNSWHLINIKDGSFLKKALGDDDAVIVNSRHNQAVSWNHFPTHCRVTATEGNFTDQFKKIIEAVELQTNNGWEGFTFQFHPEDIETSQGVSEQSKAFGEHVIIKIIEKAREHYHSEIKN